MIQHLDEEDELVDCSYVCFVGVLMHTWQSEVILGFFLVATKDWLSY